MSSVYKHFLTKNKAGNKGIFFLNLLAHLAIIFIRDSPHPPSQPLVGQGHFSIEASRSHSDTPHAVGLLCTSDRTVAVTSSWHSQDTYIHAPGEIRTRNPRKQEAPDPCLRPLPHWDRPSCVIDKQNSIWKHRKRFIFWSAYDDTFQHYKSQELLHRGGRKATSVGACGGGVGPYSRTLGRGKGAHKAQPRPLRLFWFLLLIEMPRIPRTQRERERERQNTVTANGDDDGDCACVLIMKCIQCERKCVKTILAFS